MAQKKIWDQPKPRDTQKSRINVNIKRKKDTNIKEKDLKKHIMYKLLVS